MKYLGGAAAIILVLLMYFTGSLAEGLKLGAAVILLWLIPGYVLLNFLLKDLSELEKVILGFFVGFGATALLLYYLNVLGFASITPVFSYGIGIVSLAVLVLEKFKRTPQQA